MEHDVKIRLAGGAVAVAAVVGLSVLSSTFVASRAIENRGDKQIEQFKQIVVKGSARTRIRSDLAVWRISVSGSGSDLPAAFAVLEQGVTRVRDFLREAGFAQDEVDLSAIGTTTRFRRTDQNVETGEVEAYRLDQVFVVTSQDVDKVAAAGGEVTRLLREGVLVQSQRPEYYYSGMSDLRVNILGSASHDARARADEVATQTSARVTELRSLSVGPIQLTEPNSTEVSSYGTYDTSTIEKDASVTVTATFGIAG